MGHKIIQRIYTCDLCGETPDDGGKLWHMNNQVWCESCCDKVENEEIDVDERVNKALPQDTDACSKDRNKCTCKYWGGCPSDFPF